MRQVDDSYDSIQLGGESRSAEFLGIFVAWLVVNHLIDAQVELAAGSSIARVRMQDLTGSAFLTTVLHGQLKPAHVNETGRKFIERYFVTGAYRDDFAACQYRGNNEWLLYDELAPKVTAAFRRLIDSPAGKASRRTAKILKFPRR